MFVWGIVCIHTKLTTCNCVIERLINTIPAIQFDFENIQGTHYDFENLVEKSQTDDWPLGWKGLDLEDLVRH